MSTPAPTKNIISILLVWLRLQLNSLPVTTLVLKQLKRLKHLRQRNIHLLLVALRKVPELQKRMAELHDSGALLRRIFQREYTIQTKKQLIRFYNRIGEVVRRPESFGSWTACNNSNRI